MLEEISYLLSLICNLDRLSPLVVGVSGGADSLCMLDILYKLEYPLIVAHLDHGMRRESSGDALWVQRFSEELSLDVSIHRESTLDFAEGSNLSIEEAGRILRYRYLFKQAREEKAQAVLVGHNANDQVETVLMHFLRGTGFDGLKGMEVFSLPNPWSNSIPLVRPLLGIWRKDIDAYCFKQGLIPLQDKTNLDSRFFRNRIRNHLLPTLQTYVPGVEKRIWQLTELAKGDLAILESMVTATWDEFVKYQDDSMTINLDMFNQQPLGMKRRIVRRGVGKLRPMSRDLDFALVSRVTDFASDPPRSKQADIGMGLRILIDRQNLVIIGWDDTPAIVEFPQIFDEMAIPIPSELSLLSGWVLSAKLTANPYNSQADIEFSNNLFQAYIDLKKPNSVVSLRARIPGDRFSPWGMEGKTVKISDLMINQKIPVYARKNWPVVYVEDEIAWLPGFRIAQDYAITPESKKVLFLSLKSKTS
jgi:tRNA(Ile)-lysidine synthase